MPVGLTWRHSRSSVSFLVLAGGVLGSSLIWSEGVLPDEGGETCLGAGLQNADLVDPPIHISVEKVNYRSEFEWFIYSRLSLLKMKSFYLIGCIQSRSRALRLLYSSK